VNTFFDQDAVVQFKSRLAKLTPSSERQWGKMDPAQMLAHLCKGMEQVMGDVRPPRLFLGRIIGSFIKKRAIGNDEPMVHNSPTVPGFVVADHRDFSAERERLYTLIDRAATAGPSVCTDHPHSFFGKLTPEQWGNLAYKHLDHHLRQFGV
jgi:hypothetical protein